MKAAWKEGKKREEGTKKRQEERKILTTIHHNPSIMVDHRLCLIFRSMVHGSLSFFCPASLAGRFGPGRRSQAAPPCDLVNV